MNDPLARLTTALADRYAIIREEPDLGGKNTIADHSPVLGK